MPTSWGGRGAWASCYKDCQIHSRNGHREVATKLTRDPIWLALHKQFPSSYKMLRRIGETCEGRVEQLLDLSEASLAELFGEAAAKKLCVLSSVMDEVKELWEELRYQGIRLIPFTDRAYPEKLKHLDRFPPILYVLGNLSLLKDPCVGIFGSRDVSDLGLRNAQKFGAAAGWVGLVVVSGYAKGVDTAAHRGAIEANGRTIIVTADGVSRFRKKVQFQNVGDFLQRTLVVSQFYPKQTWNVGAAMERNAVICGLSNAGAVIEASPTGGTIAAGRKCLKQGKPLWVIDYDGLPATSDGNRILIQEGGRGLQSIREWLLPYTTS